MPRHHHHRINRPPSPRGRLQVTHGGRVFATTVPRPQKNPVCLCACAAADRRRFFPDGRPAAGPLPAHRGRIAGEPTDSGPFLGHRGGGGVGGAGGAGRRPHAPTARKAGGFQKRGGHPEMGCHAGRPAGPLRLRARRIAGEPTDSRTHLAHRVRVLRRGRASAIAGEPAGFQTVFLFPAQLMRKRTCALRYSAYD